MLDAGTMAADEGIQALDSMNESLFKQEIQRPIDGGRLRCVVQRSDLIEQIVGFYGFMAIPDQLEYLVTDRCQLRAALKTKLFGGGNGATDALIVVVFGLSHC